MGDQLNQLQRNITNNGLYANRVVNESSDILEKAKGTYDNFNGLQAQYTKAQVNLSSSLNKVQLSKDKATDLFKRAWDLVAKVTSTEEEINKLENSSQNDILESLENKLQELIRLMNGYNAKIGERVQYYKQCN